MIGQKQKKSIQFPFHECNPGSAPGMYALAETPRAPFQDEGETGECKVSSLGIARSAGFLR